LESSRKLRAAGAMSDFDLQAAQTGYEAAQAQLAAARAGEAAAGEAARRANVSAPIDGAVSNRQANEGEAVNPGAVLFTVVDARYLELEGRVPAEDASRVRVGMPVEFTLDAYAGRTFRGQVTRVEPTADAATRQVGVYLRLPNTDNGIVGGLYATGRVLTGKSHTGVLVPLSALRGSGQDAYVWAIRGGKAVKQTVQVGMRDEARGSVEVLSGVSAGETVVSAPGDLNEGATVRVAAPGGVSPAERAAPAQSAQATNAVR
ncbi:MAG TPA: efflux RND transporter periplasmic adaptor subunit, partial [Longimicrobiales bacterium]